MIADDDNLADFYFGAFIHPESEDDGVARGDRLIRRLDSRVLAPVFTQQLLDHDFGFLNFRRIKLTLYREPYFAVFKTIENV